MTTRKPVFGFRIVGSTAKRRRPVHAAVALAAYAACDPRAEVHREGYLSCFWFTIDFHDYLRATGSPRDFRGVCWSPYIWWDVDRDGDLPGALAETRRLAATLDERYQLPDDALLLFHSGYKGFHAGLPTSLWRPVPSADFNRVTREFASGLAGIAGLGVYDAKRGCRIDESIYDQVRPFRAPNSRHPKTGRYKRYFAFDELMGLSLDHLLRLAEQPDPFGLPAPAARCEQAARDWQAAQRRVREQAEVKEQRRAALENGAPRLNKRTLEFIREGAAVGDRHRLLFSAAANLAEFGCPPPLAHALLTEAALDSGLPPSEVRRQIDCGLQHGRQAEEGDSRERGSLPNLDKVAP
jgi:hypothetical protein